MFTQTSASYIFAYTLLELGLDGALSRLVHLQNITDFIIFQVNRASEPPKECAYILTDQKHLTNL